MGAHESTLRPIPITDLDDPRTAPYRDVRDADLRGAHGLYIVESVVCIERWLQGMAMRRREVEARAAHATREAIETREARAARESVTPRAAEASRPLRAERPAPIPPALEAHSLLLDEEALERLRPAILEAKAGPVFAAPRRLVERISGYDHHHGALAMGRRLPDAGVDELLDAVGNPAIGVGSGSVVIATDGVVHVDNMGSIFRNAAALGAAGVLCSQDSADPLMRKTVRISMGHLFGVPWAVAADLAAALRTMRSQGWRIIAAEDHAGAEEISRTDLRGRVAIVFGAEGRGVSPRILECADAVARIPTRPGIPLNVATASAIVLHEAIRAQRH